MAQDSSMRLRSLLKTPNSPRRHHFNVSFEDPSNTPTNFVETPKSTNSSFSSGHAHSLRVPPDTISFLNGSTVEEVTSFDIDDWLPKTDYTYSKSATYRTKYVDKDCSLSPNMSRRRVEGGVPMYISDDESVEEFEEEFDNEAIMAKSRNFYGYQDPHKGAEEYAGNGIQSRRQSKARSSQGGYTSTPINSLEPHHMSAHDHYYKGMLLRSGSHIKGASRARGYRDSSSSSDALSQMSTELLVPTYRSDYDSRSELSSNKGRLGGSSNRTTTTTTTTTTIRSYEDGDGEEGDKMLNDHAHAVDDSEMKLKYDESQSEKKKRRSKTPYVLQNLDGLDMEDELSDIETFESDARSSSHRRVGGRSALSNENLFYTIVKMIITTIITTTTTSAASVSSVAVPVVTTMAMPVTVPARWMWRAMVSWCSWLLRQSATVILMEMDAKHRRRRGCCLWLLPFLLLLPLLLLAGHYAGPMNQQVGGLVAQSGAVISSVGLWARGLLVWPEGTQHQHRPVISLPPPQPIISQREEQEMDMTQINRYIEQTVVHIFNQRQSEVTPGLTSDQVRAIVQVMLASQAGSTRADMETHISAISGVLQGDVSDLKTKLLELQQQIHETNRATMVVAGGLDDAKANLQSSGGEQRNEWLAHSQALESKFLDLRNDVNSLSNQNAALVAMLKSCCQNNSALAATVRAHMVSMLSELDKDDENSALAGLMAWMQANYVDRGELDRKLSLVAADITAKMQALVDEQRAAAAVAAEGKKEDGNTEVKASIVSAGIDVNAVKSIVEEALVQFSADRVGMPDFALESAGGSVLSTRCSETYYRKTALVSVFGIPLYYTSNSPRTVIQPNVHPGECWAFRGSSGYVLIQLSQLIQPTGFTLEHIPRSLAPSGDIDSAPKAFTIHGLVSDSDTEGVNLGNYTYLDNGKPIQHFPVQNQHPGIFQYVELRVLSNHGNPEYSCIYRFRVHGLP